jgi:NADPH:quinone reductase-like Zn-dependent oxidoreductase
MIVAESWKITFLLWVLPIMVILCLLAILSVVTVLIAIRFFASYTCGRYREKTKMDGKTVIITGCTSGIGKETAKDLANRGARVIMACRNVDAAEKIKGILDDRFGVGLYEYTCLLRKQVRLPHSTNIRATMSA